jgi:hypothetical protein
MRYSTIARSMITTIYIQLFGRIFVIRPICHGLSAINLLSWPMSFGQTQQMVHNFIYIVFMRRISRVGSPQQRLIHATRKIRGARQWGVLFDSVQMYYAEREHTERYEDNPFPDRNTYHQCQWDTVYQSSCVRLLITPLPIYPKRRGTPPSLDVQRENDN